MTELTQSRPTGPRMAARSKSRGAVDDDESVENPGYLSVEALHKQVRDYLTNKRAEIEEQKEGRRYYHCAQWTAAELAILAKRNQAAITFNRIGRKINQITGIVQRQRQDPKAFPTAPNDEHGAEIATTVVREVLQSSGWKDIESKCVRHVGFEAIAGVEFDLKKGDHGDPTISQKRVRSENYFYDFESLEEDFSDKNYDGIMKWKSLDSVIEMFPKCEEELRTLVESGSDLSSNPDSENKLTFVGNRKRIRLIEHWYKHKGRWCYAFYVAHTLLEEGESPFFDENGESMSRFVMFSFAVDQDGDRYSFVRNLRGAQDEMNHRRSSGLYRAVSRQMEIVKGSVDDVEIARRERGKPDGVIERNPGDQNKITYIDQTADIAAQKAYSDDARDEIQNFANVDAAGMIGVSKNLSGRAINALQQPGMAELEPFISSIKAWKLRIYRMSFLMAQRHWTAERWIRVTEDEEVEKFLQVNGMELNEWGQPILVNALGALDVNIQLDEGPDVVNMQADAYEQIAQDPSVPFPIKLELMPIHGSVKRKIQQMLKPQGPPPPDPKIMQIQMQAQLDEKADARKAQIETVQAQADIATDKEKISAEMVQGDREFQLKRELAMMEAALEQEKFRNEEVRKDREFQQKMELAREQHSMNRQAAAQ